jgi:hypothetical protein
MADITGIGSIADLLKDGLDKIFPDKTQAEAAKAQLALAEQQGQLQELQALLDADKAQTAVNAVEAASANLFVSGWRPFVGWVCGIALGWQFIAEPILSYALTVSGHPVAFPVMDFSQLQAVLYGMLGLGAMRSYDKKHGTAHKKEKG